MPTPSPFPPSSPAYPPPTHIRPGPPVLGDLHKDSGPLHSNPADIFGDIHADVWPTYNKISQELDKKKLSKWNADLEVLLIFVSLVLGSDLQLTQTDAKYTGCLVLRHRHCVPHPGPQQPDT